MDFKNASAAEEAAALLRKSTAGTGQLATAMGTRGVQTKGLTVLSTRVSHLFAEPTKKTTAAATTKGGDIETPGARPRVHHGAAVAAVFALFAITAALSGSVVYVRRRRSEAAALAAAECPLAPSATTTEGSEQGNASPSPRSNSGKSKVTEDGGALEAGAEAAEDGTAATNNNSKNGRRRGGGAGANVAAFGSGSNSASSSDESGAAETRPLSAGRRGGNSSSARASSKKAPAPVSHRLTADDAV